MLAPGTRPRAFSFRAPLIQSRLDRLQDRRAFVAVPLAGVDLAQVGSRESVGAL
jgi:hypothetical protein